MNRRTSHSSLSPSGLVHATVMPARQAFSHACQTAWHSCSKQNAAGVVSHKLSTPAPCKWSTVNGAFLAPTAMLIAYAIMALA